MDQERKAVGQLPIPPAQPPVIGRVEIILRADGNININAPMDNVLLAMGMLAMAQNLIMEQARRQAEQPQIIPAPASALSGLHPKT